VIIAAPIVWAVNQFIPTSTMPISPFRKVTQALLIFPKKSREDLLTNFETQIIISEEEFP
jgi:hypothetical protein